MKANLQKRGKRGKNRTPIWQMKKKEAVGIQDGKKQNLGNEPRQRTGDPDNG